jgi:hypothetical protein
MTSDIRGYIRGCMIYITLSGIIGVQIMQPVIGIGCSSTSGTITLLLRYGTPSVFIVVSTVNH